MNGADWTRAEDEATVASYFEMLSAELRGEDVNKAEHRRALVPLLSGRSEGAIEFKHRNISAVLIELGFPYIDGYKPAGNYQQLLFDIVADRLERAGGLRELAARIVDRPADAPELGDILDRVVARPPRSSGGWGELRTVKEKGARHSSSNFLEREARNQALGLAGEEFVVRYEQARLVEAGHENLAANVEHVSQTRGDHLGFDVLSFEPDTSERLIEVKTTGFGQYTPFYLSRNQVDVSRAESEHYHLYRLFRFRTDPRFFSLSGALDEACQLRATEYLARP